MYCTYLTIYNGKKLPPFYIGSSTTDKIRGGYRGSVKSRRYQELWEGESDDMFLTIVLSTHSTREEALEEELRLHKEMDVVNSDLFTNMAVASPNGFFGMDTSGELNPYYGKRHSKETRDKMSKPRSEKGKKNIGIASSKRYEDKEFKNKMLNNLEVGWEYQKTPEARRKQSERSKGNKWWNDGTHQKFQKECPGDGWINGRLK